MTIVDTILRATFFFSAALLAYAYLLYPMLMSALTSVARPHSSSPHPQHRFPTVSMLIAAYNEAPVIRARIRNFLEGRYPGWSELIIVSDGSTDATAAVARAMAGARVRVLELPNNRGKAAALEFAVAHAQGEILIFSDATSVFHPDAVTHLVRRFADSEVGLVTGKVKAYGSQLAGLYHRYERYLERRETDHGVLSTAHGCIYAMRRELWRPHDPALVDDFLAPILVSLSAKRAVAEPAAICVEEFPSGAQFSRQVRMVSLAALTFRRLFPDLVRARRYRSLLVLISHKLLRWLTMLWLALLTVTTCWLLRLGGIYLAAAVVQGPFWMMFAVGAVASRHGVSGPITFAYQFVAINAAAMVGFFRFIRGRVPIVWETKPPEMARA
jgi:cellulose synthase/poly-beta-1,6-N-acetylglucosamine synthase-like glycosyltransferase